MQNKLTDRIHQELEVDQNERTFGSGWIAGTLGLVLSLIAFCLVLLIRQPTLFSVPEISQVFPSFLLKPTLYVLLISAFGLGCLNMALRKDKILGFASSVITLSASFWMSLPPVGDIAYGHGIYFGLDYFILNVIFGGILFLPLECLFPHNTKQSIFRFEWREDLLYYFLSSLLVQVLTYITLVPSNIIKELGILGTIQTWVGSLPFVLQLFAVLFLSDLFQYWMHRIFHTIPFLWRFHAVHHSAKTMDWLAGARMHFFEIIILRTITSLPVFVLGFDIAVLHIYLIIVYVYSTFVHANLSWKLKTFERFLVTPRYHHWHHGIEREAVDINFAFLFPIIDRLFNTYHLPPDQWPKGYGVDSDTVPSGYWKQFLYPFIRK